MKVFAFIIAATIFEAVGDAVMRIALHHRTMPGRIGLFAVQSPDSRRSCLPSLIMASSESVRTNSRYFCASNGWKAMGLKENQF